MYHTLFVLGAGPKICSHTIFVLSVNRVSVNRGVSESWCQWIVCQWIGVSVNRVSVDRGGPYSNTLYLGRGLKYVKLHFLFGDRAKNMYSYTFCIGAGLKICIPPLLVLGAGPKTGIPTLFVLGVGPKICIILFMYLGRGLKYELYIFLLGAGPKICIKTLFVLSVNRGGPK
jgi:hypothetical protein